MRVFNCNGCWALAANTAVSHWPRWGRAAEALITRHVHFATFEMVQYSLMN